MKKKKLVFAALFLVSLCVSAFAAYKFGTAGRSLAYIKKNYNEIVAETSLPTVEYNGENMYVAKATFYDYYSDTQVGKDDVPGEITDGMNYSKNTFNKFNTRLLEIMKYGNKEENPAKYPMYQGRQSSAFADNSNIYSTKDNTVNEKSNYWVGANNDQIGAYATTGLVDNKLNYDSLNESYLMQSNPENKKSARVPYFDKKFLTMNKHKDSDLALGSVKENVAFPFRTNEKNNFIYYEFDSAKDTVRFNDKDQLDYLGENNEKEMVKDRLDKGGFFPYNTSKDSKSNSLNFGYGVKVEVPFNMTSDGKINGQDIIFEFTGDDDVWVFIDGILALDMGGAHPKINGSINFANQESIVSGVKNNTVAFASRTIKGYGTGNVTLSEYNLINVPAVYKNHKTEFNEDLKKSLSDLSKEHTLTLFYMERGMDVSNMKMKFNLPEPNKMYLNNKIDISEVGETFKEETKIVAKKDCFLYDVVNNTNKKQIEMDLYPEENAVFIDEFKLNDVLVLQQKGLKITSRKQTELYSTSWKLYDKDDEIAQDNGLVINDLRTKEKNILFRNSKNSDVPKIFVDYVNKPLVSKFILTTNYNNDVSEDNEDKFKYKVYYSKVFGGSSKEVIYEGKYIVYDKNGKTEEKETKKGIIEVLYGQKVELVDIPVKTNIKVVYELAKNETINNIKTSQNLSYDNKNNSITGEITYESNIVEIIIEKNNKSNNKDEDKEENKGEENIQIPEVENLTNGEIEEILGDDIPVVDKPEKLENTLKNDEYDVLPKTGDETSYITWLVVLGISLILVFISGIALVKTKL